MEKQKVIKNLEAKKFNNPIITDYQLGYNDAINFALSYIKVLDDKPKKIKEIADMYDKKEPFISSTPSHYQGTIQPIELINAQNLNFNLGNIVKYVCRAGKKQGENILSDLEKAKNYINYEIERVKKWTNDNAKN